MIWFACRQCGKKHGRPESSAGTMVFCECGQGNSVPWESTTEPPPAPAAVPEPPPALPVPPRLEPIPVDEERVPVPPRPPTARPPRDPEEPPVRPGPRRRWERRPGPRRRDPRFCLNHEDTPRHKNCFDCGEAFCPDCLVGVGADSLCGPCKNFRVYIKGRSPRLSAW